MTADSQYLSSSNELLIISRTRKIRVTSTHPPLTPIPRVNHITNPLLVIAADGLTKRDVFRIIYIAFHVY